MDDVVVFDQVSKSYGGFQLDSLSFSLKKGYIHGFIGPNGAGKTTTIKLMMNLIKPDTGSIRIFGMDSRHQGKEIRQRIGFVYAENHFYEYLTVEQMKRVIASFYPTWNEAAFNRYLRMFGLPAKRKIRHLSKGMKMKYSIALALSHDADLIIMDEPTSGLDPVVRREILELLSEVIQDENKTVFFSTHITSDLEQIADYITFIHDGRIRFSQPKDEILDQYRIVKGAKELLTPDTRKLFVGLRESPYGFEGLTIEPDEVRRRFQDQVICEIPSLEEIMVLTVKGHQQTRGEKR